MPANVGRQVRALTIGSVSLISLIAFEALAVATVMPAVSTALNGLSVYSLAFGAPLASSVVGMALAGAWVDGVGVRRPLGMGVVLFAAGLLVCGGAGHIAVFIVGRAVQGLGAGMVNVCLYALVGAQVPEERRPRVFAYFSAAWVLPAMVGPSISSLILHTVGWRAVFLLVPVLVVPATVVMWPVVKGARPEPTEPAAGPARRRVVLAAAAGTGAAVLQVAAPRSSPEARAGAVLALVVVVWCARRILPPGSTGLRRGLPSVIAVRGLIAAAFAGSETYLPLLLVREDRWDPALAGAVLTLGAVTWAVGSAIQGHYPAPDSRYGISRIGTVLIFLGVATVVVAAVPGVAPATTAVGWGIAGCGMGLVYSSTSLLALHLTPPERHGEASSALSTSEALTQSVVLAIGGGFFAAFLPAHLAEHAPAGRPPYLAALSVAGVAALLSVIGARRFTTR